VATDQSTSIRRRLFPLVHRSRSRIHRTCAIECWDPPVPLLCPLLLVPTSPAQALEFQSKQSLLLDAHQIAKEPRQRLRHPTPGATRY
jgi:hypothetical protein